MYCLELWICLWKEDKNFLCSNPITILLQRQYVVAINYFLDERKWSCNKWNFLWKLPLKWSMNFQIVKTIVTTPVYLWRSCCSVFSQEMYHEITIELKVNRMYYYWYMANILSCVPKIPTTYFFVFLVIIGHAAQKDAFQEVLILSGPAAKLFFLLVCWT